MNIIERLKREMKRRKLSQEKVARELGVAANTVYRWLKGRVEPSDLAVSAIEAWLAR